MVSVSKVGGQVINKTTEFIGLSADEKPTENVVNGSSFLEIDTLDVYFWDEDTQSWIAP